MLNIGKIRIVEVIDHYDGNLLMFKFKQNKVEFHCISIQLLDEREGYLAFSLTKNISDLFQNKTSPNRCMIGDFSSFF